MADVDLIIQFDLPDLPDKPVFPKLAQAVQSIAVAVHSQWLKYAQGAPLPGGKIIPRSGNYLKSIGLEQQDDLHWMVSSTATYAEAIESGSKGYDMKKALLTSNKVRRTKDGRRYLIIPFEQGTGTGSGGGVTFGANVMAPAEYKLAHKTLKNAPSYVTGIGKRLSGQLNGVMVPQLQYQWGGRLTKKRLQEAGLAPARVNRLQGMVRFDNPKKGHSSYLTFRTMIEGSSGWQKPAVPGRYPMKTAVDKYRKVAEEAFVAAIEMDVANMLGD